MTKQEYMNSLYVAADAIRNACGEAEIGVILGSGLGDYAEALENKKSIAYENIPCFPVSTAPGHAGMWHCGMLHGKRVCMMQGRFHSYEGYDQWLVTMPIRVMKLLGVKVVIITNAAGGVNLDFSEGCLMMINDFINFSGKNPLTGPNLDEFGPRFPDMTFALDRELMTLAEDVAKEKDIPLQKGVYAWFNGPSYESPAEIRMARTMGADAVGMSTVPEIIVARHSGLRTLGISCITNMAAGILDKALTEEEVLETGRRVKGTFRALLDEIIRRA
ncbi:MAG: purine-nucleoside phosphorylase [Clostridiales bacterium]|nr:purine-nucleoside phosphorylase [Clostridiales bacterium]